MKKQKIKIFPSIEKLAINSAEFLKSKIEKIPDGNFFTMALSGGSTPKQIFKYISENYSGKINWNKIKLFWVDERCVPPDHIDSNYKMIYDSFLVKVPIPEKNIFRIHGEANPNEEAKRYAEIIKDNVQRENNVPSFDLVLLGLGEDGHTASIFPNQLGLFHSTDLCIVSKHPQTNQNRITLTGKIINNAKLIVFLVTGDNKARIASEIIEGQNSTKIFPAKLVIPSNGELIWMLDKTAAQLLNLDNDKIIREE
ncbi:MAG: 6-phosphogluconolactonase [Ignavibacteriales bacterium]|nr:6-phosphogluconolactonase [Ignavibacteriales bacterium]